MKATDIDLNTAYASGQHAGHRRPREAGEADSYYGRLNNPNFAYQGKTFSAEEMTDEQKREYEAGYWGNDDKKDWGRDDTYQPTTDAEEHGTHWGL